MVIDRSDDITKEFYNFKAVHGHAGIAFLTENKFDHVPNISKDIRVVTISNNLFHSPFIKPYLDNPDKLNFTPIILDKPSLRCGIDLIEPLYEYIENIKEKYTLYIDAYDTVLMSDIDDPQGMLDMYDCKLLFNAEDGYGFPDHGCVDKSYVKKYAEFHNCDEHIYYVKNRDLVSKINTENLQKRIQCFPLTRSLNSGLYLGETEYLKEILTIMMQYMYDDPTKGYPFGEIENQKLWQYLQSICENEEIQIDYMNLYFLWNHDHKFTYPVDHWEHFNYFNKLQTIKTK
jgi:hypothetical protein